MSNTAEKLATNKVIIGPVRVAYPHFHSPTLKYESKTDYRYEGTVLIPKSDTATWQRMKDAAAASVYYQVEKNGGKSPWGKPAKKVIEAFHLTDGDEVADAKLDENKPHEWSRGHWTTVVRAGVKTRDGRELPPPGFILSEKGPNGKYLSADREMPSGDYYKLSLNCVVSSNGGQLYYTFYLSNVMHWGEGEPIGSGGVKDAANEDWGDDVPF